MIYRPSFIFVSLMCFFSFIQIVYNDLGAQVQAELREFATGLTNPLGIVHAGDERLFVIEKRGSIRAIDEEGNFSGFFLDIRDRVRSLGGEQGLLGLAFHPDFSSNGYFYVNYTNQSGATVVSRFLLDSLNFSIGDKNSELIILEFDQPFSNHNGGQLLFGPDGYLYIFTGDGGSGGDPINAGQDPLTFLGKILRIDIDGGLPYSIPEDNPFAGTDFELDEIWALGLRNPWRNSFDRLSGDLWIADVGQSAREEINLQAASSSGGENYGWRCYEGNLPFNLSGNCNPDDFVFPIYEYVTHGPIGCSITGGYVYRGDDIPDWNGSYIFGDFCTGLIILLEWDSTLMEYRSEELFNIFGGQLASFGEDINGELYVTHYGQGRISKIVNPCNDIAIEYEWTLPECWDSQNGFLSIQLNNAEEPIEILWSDGYMGGLDREMGCGLVKFEIQDNRGCEVEFTIDLDCRERLFPMIEQKADTLVSSEVGAFYRWYSGGVLILESKDSFFVPSQSGTYWLEVLDQEGCSYISEPYDFILSATFHSYEELYINAYPNPTKDLIFLEVPVLGQVWRVSIYNSEGRMLRSETIYEPGRIFELSMSDFPAGWYLIELKSDEEDRFHIKINKEK